MNKVPLQFSKESIKILKKLDLEIEDLETINNETTQKILDFLISKVCGRNQPINLKAGNIESRNKKTSLYELRPTLKSDQTFLDYSNYNTIDMNITETNIIVSDTTNPIEKNENNDEVNDHKVEDHLEAQKLNDNLIIEKDDIILCRPGNEDLVVKNSDKIITYITICSSVATTSKNKDLKEKETKISAPPIVASQVKASDLYGTSDDSKHFTDLMMSIGEGYTCCGSFQFSKNSLSSLGKNEFLNTLKIFFNKEFTSGSLIYYSGHGFTDGTVLLERENENYTITYEEIIDLWRKRTYPKENRHLLLIMDCCYSGIWTKKLLHSGDWYDVSIQASTKDVQTSRDLGAGIGSLFTNLFIKENLNRFKKSIPSNFESINKIDLLKESNESQIKILNFVNFHQPHSLGLIANANSFGLLGLNSNSWIEMLSKINSKDIKNFRFKGKSDKYSCLKLSTIGMDSKLYHFWKQEKFY